MSKAKAAETQFAGPFLLQRSLLCVALFWLLVAVFIGGIEPGLNLRYEVPASGAMGCPTVTGTNPATGMIRAAVFLVLMGALGAIVFRSRWMPMWRAWRDRPVIAPVTMAIGAAPLLVGRIALAKPDERVYWVVAITLAVAMFYVACRWGLVGRGAQNADSGTGGLRVLTPAHSRLLLWLILLCIIGLTARAPGRGLDDHHEGEAVVPAWRVHEGEIPYRDFWTIHSVAVDVLPSWLGMKIWGPSVHSTRLARGYIAAPLRAVLVWLILAELFPLGPALLLWGVLAVYGQFNPPSTNEAFRLAPVLVALWLYLRFVNGREWGTGNGEPERHGNDRDSVPHSRFPCPGLLGYLAMVVAALAAVLSPEIGVPFAVGLGVTLVFASWPKIGGNRAPVFRRLLAVLIAGAVAIAAGMAAAGMWPGFSAFVKMARAMGPEIVARWPQQSMARPEVMAQLLIAAVMIGLVLRQRSSPRAVMVAPLAVMALALIPMLLVDHPDRFGRNILLNALCLAVVAWQPPDLAGDRRGRPSIVGLCAILLLCALGGFFSLTGPQFPAVFSISRPAGYRVATHPRLGLALPETQRRAWEDLAAWRAHAGSYFNGSNSVLESFVLDHPAPTAYVPMHCGYRPEEQATLVAGLKREQPQRILFRTDNDPAFWQVAPYTLIFDVLDAEIVEQYQFEEQVGPYHVVRRAEALPRTQKALFAPGPRKPLKYGRAPYYLGRDDAAGMARVCAARPSLAPERKRYLEAKITGQGEARLVIRPKEDAGVASDAALEVEFELLSAQTPETYCFPLWNLCFWGDQRPEEVFAFEFEDENGSVQRPTAVAVR